VFLGDSTGTHPRHDLTDASVAEYSKFLAKGIGIADERAGLAQRLILGVADRQRVRCRAKCILCGAVRLRGTESGEAPHVPFVG
jgi:hypothetical protein